MFYVLSHKNTRVLTLQQHHHHHDHHHGKNSVDDIKMYEKKAAQQAAKDQPSSSSSSSSSPSFSFSPFLLRARKGREFDSIETPHHINFVDEGDHHHHHNDHDDELDSLSLLQSDWQYRVNACVEKSVSLSMMRAKEMKQYKGAVCVALLHTRTGCE